MAELTGRGTVLKMGESTPSITISQRVSISGPTRSMGTIETTNLDSAGKTFRPTLYDNGELKVHGFFDPAATDHSQLETWMQTQHTLANLLKCELTFADPDGAGVIVAKKYTFDGILTSLELGGMENEGYLTFDATIKISGAITKA